MKSVFIHGVFPILKNLNMPQHHVYTKNITDDIILKEFEKDIIKLNHKKLEGY